MEEKIQKEDEKKITDAQYITEWRSMISTFKDLIKDNPKPEAIREELNELSEEAKNTIYLTPNQRSGIVERCNNYLNGTFGKNLSKASS
jgi:hypothetical protein